MPWIRSQHDILIGRPCEDEGYCDGVFRIGRERAGNIPGGQADALKRRLGYLRAIRVLRLLFSRVRAGPLAAILLAGRVGRLDGAGRR